MRNKELSSCNVSRKSTNHLTMDNFFDNVLNEFFGKDMPSVNAHLPSTNVLESKDDFQLEIVAPGWKKSDFKINLEENILTIKAENKAKKSDKTEEKQTKFIRKEFSQTSLKRSFTLPKNVDIENIAAEYTQGILRLSIPKLEEVKTSKTIQIA